MLRSFGLFNPRNRRATRLESNRKVTQEVSAIAETARRAVSVEFFSTAAQLYEKIAFGKSCNRCITLKVTPQGRQKSRCLIGHTQCFVTVIVGRGRLQNTKLPLLLLLRQRSLNFPTSRII